MKRFYLFILTVIVAALSACNPGREVVVDKNLPAGNIVFERMVNDTVYVHQELRGSKKAWFYWAFRVTGAQGKKLTFVFTKSFAICERGPVVSLDKGKSYEYLAEEGATKFQFTYDFPADAKEVWFYECHPYTPEMWYSFINAPHKGQYETGVLCKSRKGRDVPFFRISPKKSAPKLSVVVSCRHHCSEAPAGYVVEGFTAAFLEDSELGQWLRDNIELNVVPFVDIDGSVEGDQGKWRLPHDHNRDYTEFRYPETAALASLIAETQPDIYLDCHNPKLYKYNDNYIYTPYRENPNPKEFVFSSLLEKYQEGGLNYRTSDNLPFGTSWNSSSNYQDGLNATQWVYANIQDIKVARTIEFPFAYSNGALVYPGKLRQFGHGIARTLKAFAQGEE